MIEIYRDTAGKFRWRAKSPNGQVIATSHQGYTRKDKCLQGLEATRREFYTVVAGSMDLDVRDRTGE